jgi:outer membrane receptor protein involved in Fe transport
VRIEGGPNDYSRVQWQQGDQDGYLAINGTHDGGYQDSCGFDQQKMSWKQQQTVGDKTLTHYLTATHMDQQSISYLVGDEAYRDDARKRDNDKPEAYRDVDAVRYVQSWDWQQQDFAFSVKPYLRYSAMDFTQHFNFQEPLEENNQHSAGIQAIANRLHLSWGEWQSGAEMEWAQGQVKEWQTLPTVGTAVQGTHYDYQVDMQTAAAWQSLTWHMLDQVDVQGGVRLDRVLYNYDNATEDGAYGRFNRPADRSDGYTLVSPRVGLIYTDTFANEWYASLSRGNRAPQTGELYRLQGKQSVADISEVTADGGELGWRGTARDKSDWETQWNIALFSMHKDGVIIRNSNSVLENSAKTTHEGIEVGVQQSLPADFYLDVAATYAEHRYASEVFDKSLNVDGNRMDTAPRTLGSVQLGWRPANTRLELEWVHVGNYALNPENTFTYAGHDLLNFRASQQLSREWNVFFRVMNLTDQEYAERADVTAAGTVQPRYFVGLPRSVFVGVEWTY